MKNVSEMNFFENNYKRVDANKFYVKDDGVLSLKVFKKDESIGGGVLVAEETRKWTDSKGKTHGLTAEQVAEKWSKIE